MEPKDILLILMVMGFVFFLYGPGSRLLKKKSHHYIVPPSPERDPNWTPVEMDEYAKYIFFKQNSEEDTVGEVSKVILNEFSPITFEINIENSWVQIKIIHSNFSDFHNLVALCTFINGNKVTGVCIHSNRSNEDYVVKLDVDSGMEHMIGSFRTNQNFGIYLPKLDNNPKGNISKSPVKEIDFQDEIKSIPSFDKIMNQLNSEVINLSPPSD